VQVGSRATAQLFGRMSEMRKRIIVALAVLLPLTAWVAFSKPPQKDSGSAGVIFQGKQIREIACYGGGGIDGGFCMLVDGKLDIWFPPTQKK